MALFDATEGSEPLRPEYCDRLPRNMHANRPYGFLAALGQGPEARVRPPETAGNYPSIFDVCYVAPACRMPESHPLMHLPLSSVDCDCIPEVHQS